MAYSQVGIVNLALNRIGVKGIAAMTENSAQAIAANMVYGYILDEVLQTKDWKFAKTRLKLAKNTTTPVHGYDYAYNLPDDFLRLCLDKKTDPAVTPSWETTSDETIFYEDDARLISIGYSIEALEDGTLCLLTDYDNTSSDLFINYIRKVTNPGLYSASFINALAFRLAAELAVSRTEDKNKYSQMMGLYSASLLMADGVNQSLEYVKDETGDNSWEMAGR